MARISSRSALFGLEGMSKETVGEGQRLTALEEEHVGRVTALSLHLGVGSCQGNTYFAQ